MLLPGGVAPGGLQLEKRYPHFDLLYAQKRERAAFGR